MRPARSTSAPVASASSAASGDACTPAAQITVPARRCARVPSRPVDVDADGVDADDPGAHAQLDAELLELRACRLAGEPVAEGGQRLVAAVERAHPHRRRVDRAELAAQAAHGQLADLAGELDAGRAGADDDDRQPLPPLRRVGRALRHLERAEDAAPQLERVVDRLHARARTARTRRARSTTGRRRRRRSGCRRARSHCSSGRGGACTTRRSRSKPVDLGQLDRHVLRAGAARAAAAGRSARATGCRSPPGRAAAGTGGGCAGRPASRRPASARATGWPAGPRSRRRRPRPGESAGLGWCLAHRRFLEDRWRYRHRQERRAAGRRRHPGPARTFTLPWQAGRASSKGMSGPG